MAKFRDRDYFHGRISKNDAEKQLEDMQAGTFLVRVEQFKKSLLIILTLKDQTGKIRHVCLPNGKRGKKSSILKLNTHLKSKEETLDHVLKKGQSQLKYPLPFGQCHQSNYVESLIVSLTCTICETQYPTEKRLNNHMDMTHRITECGACDKIIFPFQFAGHKNNCTLRKIIMCNKCGYTTQTSRLLTAHKKVHEKYENAIKCQHCDKYFVSEERLNSHFNWRHKRDFKCTYCDQKFTTKGAQHYHEQNMHTFINGKALHKCSLCTFTCEDSFTMQVHKAKHRKKNFGPFICKNCNREFKSQDNLIKHVKKRICKKITVEESEEEVVLSFF